MDSVIKKNSRKLQRTTFLFSLTNIAVGKNIIADFFNTLNKTVLFSLVGFITGFIILAILLESKSTTINQKYIVVIA
jgi:hypothetical protein